MREFTIREDFLMSDLADSKKENVELRRLLEDAVDYIQVAYDHDVDDVYKLMTRIRQALRREADGECGE